MKRSTVPDWKLSFVTKNEALTVKCQCELLEINLTSYYNAPKMPEEEAVKREEYIKYRHKAKN